MAESDLDDLAFALGELAASANFHEHTDSTGPRLCPVCGTRMTLFKQFDVVMDVCESHGVWLDQGELATLFERMYWNRRDSDEKRGRDQTRHMDETRRIFTAGMKRVAGCTAKFDR